MSQVAVDAGEANPGDAEEAGEEEKEEGGGRGAWCGPPLVPVVLLQMVLGTVTAALALAMSDLSPSLRPRDTPYWAGLPVRATSGRAQRREKAVQGSWVGQ